jgi:hypothetical protein
MSKINCKITYVIQKQFADNWRSSTLGKGTVKKHLHNSQNTDLTWKSNWPRPNINKQKEKC